MSSTTQQSSSRFSTLKIFRLASSKPPPPPPKDAVYLYASANNTSLLSLSNQSVRPTTPSPKQTNPNGPLSIRSPSPTPSRVLQSSSPQQQHPSAPGYHQRQSPSASMSSSTLSPDHGSGSSKRSFIRKLSNIGRRPASKSSRVASTEEASDDESISRPWNFQHHIHIDEAFQGIPPTWSSALAELGYSEAEIALILKGRRDRVPDPSSVQDCPPSTTPSRSQSPTSTVNPPVRSTSLRRQRSDGSIARSERSLRVGPPPPPPPLPLPPAPQAPQVPSPSLAPPVPPPPTPASGGSTSSKASDVDSPSTPSEAQYVYINHQGHTQNGSIAVPPPAPVPIIQPAPVRQPPLSRSNSAKSARSPPSRSGSISGDRERAERRFRVQPPPRRPFRVVNETSPPPAYSDDSVPGSPPPPISLEDAMQPRPQEKAQFSPAPAPQSRIKTPPPAIAAPPGATAGLVESPTRKTEEGRGVQGVQDHYLDRSNSEHRRFRPTILSIPPRVSLRKDTLEDLSSWSASLFSSLPSTLHESPSSSASTPATSASTTQSSMSENGRHRTKPSVTLPTIVLHQEVSEEREDEDGEEDDEDIVEHDYTNTTASPLYHELMGMMQGQAAAANGVGSPGPGSPASPGFQQLETASLSSHDTTSRDSQLTIRFNPRRDSSRDSSASTSTLTHATIVRGASIVRRVRADVVTTPPAFTTVKGKERGRERSPVRLVEIVQDDNSDYDDDNDDGEGDSSSDSTGSDEDDSPGSPVGTLAFTSAPNSLEDSGGRMSPRQAYGRGSPSPLPSPSPSPLRASFTVPVSEEEDTQAQAAQKEIHHAPMQGPYVTPPPSAAPLSVRRPQLPIPLIDVESPNGVPTPSSSSPSSSSWQPMEQTKDEIEDGIVPPTFTATGAATPRYPAWLAAVVLPLAEFIDDSADPRALFKDLQEIAQGESGSVYSAHAAPAVAHQFQPAAPRSPMPGRSSPLFSSSTLEKDGEEEEEEGDNGSGTAQQKNHKLVAIKRVLLLPGGTEKLVDLRRELELARALRHANVLRMERLYVDVVDQCLWIGMELMDRSLADVLAVVGEDAGLGSSDRLDSEAMEAGSSYGREDDSVGAGVVEIPERMVARFVSDVLLALSYLCKHHIAHRDVRSDNLLLSRSGVVKLSDFSNAVRSPPGTPKRSDPAGVIYWQAPEMRTGFYDPLKVDVWSLGATAWELVHADPPFSDIQDTRHIVGTQLPPVRQPDDYSRSFHDFLDLCSQPAASRPDPDELLNTSFVRTACPRSEIVRLLGQCKAIDEQQLLRQSIDFE